mmetsp:Transcript_12969/g.29841  ORF Transcript_12969/g.29841 Transcript_12969/m.29841 type:complete len:275 (-) Transcript_12969:1424-2248(-)
MNSRRDAGVHSFGELNSEERIVLSTMSSSRCMMHIASQKRTCSRDQGERLERLKSAKFRRQLRLKWSRQPGPRMRQAVVVRGLITAHTWAAGTTRLTIGHFHSSSTRVTRVTRGSGTAHLTARENARIAATDTSADSSKASVFAGPTCHKLPVTAERTIVIAAEQMWAAVVFVFGRIQSTRIPALRPRILSPFYLRDRSRQPRLKSVITCLQMEVAAAKARPLPISRSPRDLLPNRLVDSDFACIGKEATCGRVIPERSGGVWSVGGTVVAIHP